MGRQPNTEPGNNSIERRRRDLLKVGAIVAIGVAALSGCNSERANATNTPSPTSVSAEATPHATPTTEQSVAPTEKATQTGETSLDKPVVVNGSYGNEYAPLHSTDILTPTVPMEKMQAMDYTEFAKQPIQDRLNYLNSTLINEGYSEETYFSVDANFTPGAVVGAWSRTQMHAFSQKDPQECAKLSIADMMYTIDPNTNGLSNAAETTAKDYKNMCETKQPGASFITSFVISKEQPADSIRKDQVFNNFSKPQKVSEISYDVYTGQDVTDHRTQEAIELTFKLSNGQTVVGYARGLDQ